jgi:hypothetical protein
MERLWQGDRMDLIRQSKRPSKSTVWVQIRQSAIGDEIIHAEARRMSDKKIFVVPLDYLKVKPRKSKNFSLVDDYGVWFVNYR